MPMSMALDYIMELLSLTIVYGICAMSLFLMQPVEMVQPSTLRVMYRIAHMKTFSTNIMLRMHVCLPERRQAYIDVLESSICGDSATASDIEDTCSVDANEVPCGILYHQSFKDLARLDSACSTSNVSCTSNCRDGITAAKKRYGCCFRSVWFYTSGTASYLSPSVLRSCDINLPRACEGLIGSAMSIMKENYISLIVTVLMCLQLMMTA